MKKVIVREKGDFVSKLSLKISLKGISIEFKNKEKKRPSNK
ncbi:MAG: hypothetical protein ACRC30_02225 [Clostridium sp.]